MAEEKPYVAYRLSADVKDKGIGFCIKKAVTTYLQHNNLTGKLCETKATSDQFEGVLHIYPNGNLDLNMNALVAHIEGSGRMPSKESRKPTIHIEPVIPAEYGQLVERAPVASDDQWVKTVDQLHTAHAQEVEGFQQRASSLTHAVEGQKRLLEDKDGKIRSLEARLKTMSETEFDSPLKAVIDGYLRKGLETFWPVYIDHEMITSNDDVDFFIRCSVGERRPAFFEYINDKHKRTFKSDEDLFEWQQKTQTYDSWRVTPNGMAVLAGFAAYECDLHAVQAAEKSQASPAMIDAMRSVLTKHDVPSIEAKKVTCEREHAEDRAMFGTLSSLRESYWELLQVLDNSSKRREAKSAMMLLVHRIQGSESKVSVYMPSFEANHALHSCLNEAVTRQVAVGGDRERVIEVKARWESTPYSNEIVRLDFMIEPQLDTLTLHGLHSTVTEDIMQSFPVTELPMALGVVPTPILLKEQQGIMGFGEKTPHEALQEFVARQNQQGTADPTQ